MSVSVCRSGNLIRPLHGAYDGLRYKGQHMLHGQHGPEFNSYRSIDNDVREWKDIKIQMQEFKWDVAENGTSATVTTKLEAHVDRETVPYEVVYRIYGNGAIDVEAAFHTGAKFSLPRLALEMYLSPRLEQVKWYGRGPIENYRDRRNAAYVGVYETTVRNMAESYVRAQSMGGRTDTRWLLLTDRKGRGLKISTSDTFDFSALHYTDRDLWQVKYGHDLNSIRRAEVVLNLDCIQRGIGNASCGPQPRPKYEIQPDTTYRYAFRIEPYGMDKPQMPGKSNKETGKWNKPNGVKM